MALQRGVHADVDDLESVRRHFELERFDLLGHSYVGVTVILYALRHGERLGRVVQLSPMGPVADKQYPSHLTGADETLREVMAKLALLRAASEPADPIERCRKLWSVLRLLYVTDAADAGRADWGRCELPNERGFLRYWMGELLPSLRALELTPRLLAAVQTPVLTIHGTHDRSAPYGGARDWAMLLPAARLLTVEGAGHAPWIEAPERVLGAIAAFLAGEWRGGWPDGADEVR